MNLIQSKQKVSTRIELSKFWRQNTLGTEYSLHQLAPYIGKLKSSIAKGIILNFTIEGDTIYDPYCGASTIPLEACILNRNVIANDLNPYAYVLSLAKLNPPNDLNKTLSSIISYSHKIENVKKDIDLRKVPQWIRKFYHKETLREIIAWIKVLKDEKNWFLLSCLLGILHHQRPGFLSYPSSHSVPYLRIKKFPRKNFPHLYEYRNVFDRLNKKVIRAFRRMPIIDSSIKRRCTNVNASTKNKNLKNKIDAIVTSPPYMRSLDYARDNRLRLWFLDCKGWESLDKIISPSEKEFLNSIKKSLVNWRHCLKENGKCILILGDNFCSTYKMKLPDAIEQIAVKEIRGYRVVFKMRNLIPDNKRTRRNLKGNKYETILVLEKK